MDLQKKEAAGVQSEDNHRAVKRLAGGLEDVSHLFLTQPSNGGCRKSGGAEPDDAGTGSNRSPFCPK